MRAFRHSTPANNRPQWYGRGPKPMPHEYDLAALSHGRIILAETKGFVLAKEQLLNELAVEIVTQPSTEHVVPEWIANAVDAKLTTVSDADNVSLATMV